MMKKLLMKHRITAHKQLPPMRFLFRFAGTPCFPVSELVAETGRAKSGKTLFMSIVMTCAVKETGSGLSLERMQQAALKVLWFDTEQSEQSTQDILVNRIMPLAGIRYTTTQLTGLTDQEGMEQPPLEVVRYYNARDQEVDFDDQFYAINARGVGWERRRELLPLAISEFKPDLVIVDGTKDLMLDINDATQATETTEDLMRWAQLYGCCIVNVLHQNKAEGDRNMRGSIGTELTNKAFEIFSCELVGNEDDNQPHFKVAHAMSRKVRSRQKLYYTLDGNGLPLQCEEPDEQPRDTQGRFRSPKPAGTVAMVPDVKWESFNQKYLVYGADKSWSWNLRKLFYDAMENHSGRTFSELMAAAMRLSRISNRQYYYERLNEAIAQGIVRREQAPKTGQQYIVLCDDNALPF